MAKDESNLIIYNTVDGRASVVLYARDGSGGGVSREKHCIFATDY